MTAPLKTIEGTGDIAGVMREIGRRARAAAHILALASTDKKNQALSRMAKALHARRSEVLAANAEDLADARKSNMTPALLDRLTLDEARILAMADGIDVIAKLIDPVGTVTESWKRPNGITIERARVEIGTHRAPVGLVLLLYIGVPSSGSTGSSPAISMTSPPTSLPGSPSRG